MNIKDLLIRTDKDINLNNLDMFKITNAFLNNNLKFDLSCNEIIECIRNNIPEIEVVHEPSTNINTMILKTTNTNDKFFLVSNPLKNDIYINKFNQKNSLIYSQSIHLESLVVKNKKQPKIDNIILNFTISDVNIETKDKTELFNQIISFDIIKRKIESINNFKEDTFYKEIAIAIESKNEINEAFLDILELKYDIIDSYIKNIIIEEICNKRNSFEILELANKINKKSSVNKNEKQRRII